MTPPKPGKLRTLAQRLLDGDRIDWGQELDQSPDEGEAIRGLREIGRIVEVHRREALAASHEGRPRVRPGATIVRWGHLRLLEKIGEGSYGEVFRAYDPRLQIDVALKLFRSTLQSATGSLLAEARSLARVRHPNVLMVYGADRRRGRVGMWSELLHGRTLEQLLADRGPFSAKEAAVIGLDLCRALGAVHGARIVHGDVKTSNVMRETDGRIVITDFGAAASLEGDARTGTPITAAPEQLLGQRTTPLSDIYGLGVLLHRLATGRYPIEADSIDALREAHRIGMVPVPGNEGGLPDDLLPIIRKALAPRPEHRYRNVDQMGEALAGLLDRHRERPQQTPLPDGSGTPMPARGRKLHPARIVAAVAVVALLTLAAFMAGRHPHAAQVNRRWILVADFDAPPGQADLGVATQELVTSALEQSRAVAAVPREQVRIALARAGRPADSRVSGVLARELAYRSAVGAVAEGVVRRLGRGFTVVVRVSDAENDRAICSESVLAPSEDALIPALGHLVERLRRDLGENERAIRSGLPVEVAATPSFEAFRLYARAFYLETSMRHHEAIPLIREAIALDPNFAMAWDELGLAYLNTAQADSGLAAIDEARRRPGRLTAIQRGILDGDRSLITGDLHAALTAYDRALEDDPASLIGLVNSSVALYQLGRFHESLDRIRMSERSCPYGATELQRCDEARVLICLGRVPEARRLLPLSPGFQTALEIASGNWTAAESIAADAAGNPRASPRELAANLFRLASAQAARGAVRLADSTYERAGALDARAQARFSRLMLSVATGGRTPLPEDSWAEDASTAMLLTRGLEATVRGDRPSAERLLGAARAGASGSLQTPAAILEAQIEALSGRPEEAVEILRPIVTAPASTELIGDPPSLSAARWFLADAFERLGRPDSAAASLETIVSDPAPLFREASVRGIFLPFAHHRLARLYAEMGREDDAKNHWRSFVSMLRTPDPELEPLIREARLAKADASIGAISSLGASGPN